MTTKRAGCMLLAAVCVGALLGSPGNAAAQTSVFINDYVDRPVFNPCTTETVLLSGTVTTTITVSLTGSDQLRVDVDAVDKGTGVGTNPLIVPPNTYSFSDSQHFDAKFTIPSDPASITESSFSDKLFLKGAKALDNWMVKRTIKLHINANGVATVAGITLDSDTCKG